MIQQEQLGMVTKESRQRQEKQSRLCTFISTMWCTVVTFCYVSGGKPFFFILSARLHETVAGEED